MSTETDVDYQDQLDIAARLEADDFFSDITVLVQRKGVTDSDVETALTTLNQKSGKLGACVVVLMSELVTESREAPGPHYLDRARVQVFETPMFNLGDDGTGKSAEKIAKRVRVLLHHVAFGSGRTYAFTRQDPVEVQEGTISYMVTFERLEIDNAEPRLAPPTISADGPGPITVSLAHVDEAAQILYTLDGSYPRASNSNAAVYSTPLSISSPTTLRAVAYRSGYRASDVAQAVVTTA